MAAHAAHGTRTVQAWHIRIAASSNAVRPAAVNTSRITGATMLSARAEYRTHATGPTVRESGSAAGDPPDRTPAFEAALRAVLGPYENDGDLVEDVAVSVLTGQR